MPVHITTCPQCHRDFLASVALAASEKCQEHCTKSCCRKVNCSRGIPVRPLTGKPRGRPRVHPPELDIDRKCFACGRHLKDWEAFAPCTSNCIGRMYFYSSAYGLYAQRWVSACHLYEDGLIDRHRPDQPPRIHIKYCSLRCYNSVEFGHETTEKQKGRVRARRSILKRKDEAGTFVGATRSFGELVARVREQSAGLPWWREPT